MARRKAAQTGEEETRDESQPTEDSATEGAAQPDSPPVEDSLGNLDPDERYENLPPITDSDGEVFMDRAAFALGLRSAAPEGYTLVVCGNYQFGDAPRKGLFALLNERVPRCLEMGFVRFPDFDEVSMGEAERILAGDVFKME